MLHPPSGEMATTARRPQPRGGFRPHAVGNPAMWECDAIIPQRLPTLKEFTVLEKERRSREAAFSIPNLERRYERTLAESAALRFMPGQGGRLRTMDHVACRPAVIPSYGTNSYGTQKDSRKRQRKPSNAAEYMLPDILSNYRVRVPPPPIVPVPPLRMALPPVPDAEVPLTKRLGGTLNTLPASGESIARRQQNKSLGDRIDLGKHDHHQAAISENEVAKTPLSRRLRTELLD